MAERYRIGLKASMPGYFSNTYSIMRRIAESNENNDLVRSDVMSKTVLLTKYEAEVKLKELRGGENER